MIICLLGEIAKGIAIASLYDLLKMLVRKYVK
jgi:hypothetical protein